MVAFFRGPNFAWVGHQLAISPQLYHPNRLLVVGRGYTVAKKCGASPTKIRCAQQVSGTKTRTRNLHLQLGAYVVVFAR